MNNLLKALELLFVAKVSISNAELLLCSDLNFEKFLASALEKLNCAESVLVSLVPSSEVLSLFNSIYDPNSVKK